MRYHGQPDREPGNKITNDRVQRRLWQPVEDRQPLLDRLSRTALGQLLAAGLPLTFDVVSADEAVRVVVVVIVVQVFDFTRRQVFQGGPIVAVLILGVRAAGSRAG